MFSPHTQHTPQLLRPFPQRGAGVRRDMNSTSQNFMVDIGYWLIIILNLELLVLSHPKQAENIKPQTLIDWCILCARSWKEGGSWAHQIQCSYSLVAAMIRGPNIGNLWNHPKTTLIHTFSVSKWFQIYPRQTGRVLGVFQCLPWGLSRVSQLWGRYGETRRHF